MDKREKMWPLDVLLVALAGLVLYVVATQLRFDDARWTHNAWTYVVAIPLVAFVLAVLLHGLASRYVQRSIQVGFLFSVLVHLLLMMLAINIVIFSHYFPKSTAGVKPERSPVRKTVPEYLFNTPREQAETPDWSKPTEATTASRVIPEEKRMLPPLEHTRPKLEMPRPPKPQPERLKKFMVSREQPAQSIPKPSDSPGKLARRKVQDDNPAASLSEPIQTPDVEPSVSNDKRQIERQVDLVAPSARSGLSDRRTDLSSAAPRNVTESIADLAAAQPSARAQRQTAELKPQVGETGMVRQRTLPKRSRRPQPAGSAAAPTTISVARESNRSHRVLSPAPTPAPQRSKATGAQLLAGDFSGAVGKQPRANEPNAGAVVQGRAAARAGTPNVSPGESSGPIGRSGRRGTKMGFVPAGAPNATDGILAVGRGTDGDVGLELNDRGESVANVARRSTGKSGSTAPSPAGSIAVDPTIGLGPALDVLAETGPAGLANRAPADPGVIPSMESPRIAALDLSRDGRPRRDVGGPSTPAGSKIASVESFSRRVMRTDAGAAPTPAGMVGPATEEAIERGLAYLASTQLEDGSWSLEGHGERVVLDSHTAATGLCLLAFQGAGYTHLKHQYADTVSRGLSYLVTRQRSNGDLYVRENELSDRNVALYSHGIASLAVCEAYGMTQDPELREPAEQAIRYITLSQHPQRGGWRYTPGVSSDTSVTGWMMMALKSGDLAGLEVPQETYDGIEKWLEIAKESDERPDRYRYNPFAPDTPSQRHGRLPTPTMTAVGMLMRMYSGWRRDNKTMRSAADYLLRYPPQIGTRRSPQRDTYYWYYATQVMFHMGDKYWDSWNKSLNPVLLEGQIQDGADAGSWDPNRPVPDRWSPHAGRLYVTTMNLLNLEVYYRHLPIYEDTAE